MSDLRIIALATVAALVCMAIARNAERKGQLAASRFALLLALAAACYLIWFGVTLVRSGQESVFMSSPFVGGLDASGEINRTWLTLLIAKNWAYAVILLGAALVIAVCKQLLRQLTRSW
jgi:dolichyl-phosphate-mannose--protein O-mannosyl transferase